MQKHSKVLIIGLSILIIITGVLGFVYKNKNKEINSITFTDEEIFKTEYELFNGKSNGDGKEYQILEIDEYNGAEYIKPNEVIKLIENGTGIIYFGFPACPWCRNALPVLLNSLKNNDINKFYYMNILDIRSTYVLDKDNKPIMEKEGTVDYYKILEALKDKLSDYTLTINEGKKIGDKVSTGELRLFAPTVVFVRNGVVDIHVGTVESQSDPYIPLTQEQKDELSNIFTASIKKIYDESCNEGC